MSNLILVRRIGLILPVFLALAALSACSSTPTQPTSEPGVELQYPISDVHRAALSALIEHGFEVTADQEAYIEGKRPHKVGALVGSGGETIGVWLLAINDETTQVKVDTAKSFVGMAGQRDWDDDVMASIRAVLDES